MTRKFYEEIECEHGWTDSKGFAICNLGSGCSIGFECYCVKNDCPIYEEELSMKVVHITHTDEEQEHYL